MAAQGIQTPFSSADRKEPSTLCLYQNAMLARPTSVAGSMQTDNVVYTGKEGWPSTRSSMVVPSNDVAADLDWRQVVSPAE